MEPPDLPNMVMLAVPAFVLTMLLELGWGRMTGKARYDTRDTAASLAMGTGNLAIGIAFGFISFGVLMFLYDYRLMTWGFSIPAFIIGFFIDDLRYYLYHRIAHESRWWWWGHVTHHSSQHYNLSTALRQDWAGPFNLSFLMRAPLVVFLGMHPVMLAFLGGINLVYQYWVHTEAIRRFPAPIEWFFNTPSHHRVHHGSNPRYLDANYAGTFIIWDRLFGTFVPELDEEPVRYGLVKNLGTHNPVRIAYHELASLVKDATQPGLSLSERLRYVFDRPGYSHDGSRRTAPMIKADFVAHHPDEAGKPGLPAPRSTPATQG
jgi:sterol desaturase/sphingolipid hydroxylase (fatty acid hydroxylase superfamily)